MSWGECRGKAYICLDNIIYIKTKYEIKLVNKMHMLNNYLNYRIYDIERIND